MSKRGPIIVVGIVVVLLLASPFAIGMMTENGLRDQIDVYDRNVAVSATVDSYQRGWLDSTANLSFGFSDTYLQQLTAIDPTMKAAALLQDLKIPVIVEIKHGPVLVGGGFGVGTASVRAYVDPASPIVVFAEQLLGMPYVFEFRGRGGLGGFRFEGEIPASENAFPDGSYAFSGLDFNGTARGGNIVLEAIIDSLSVESPFFSAILESLAVNYDYQYREEQIGLGDAEISVARIVANNPLLGAEPMFSADGMRMASNVSETEDGAYLDMQVSYSLDGLSVIDAFSVNDAAIGVRLGHIDAQAVQDLQHFVEVMTPGSSPDQLTALMLPIYDRAVAGNPQIELDPIRFTMPEGSVDGRFDLTIDSSALPTGAVMDFQDPQVAMQALRSNLELTISKTLAQNLAGMAMSQQMAAQMGPGAAPIPQEQMDAMLAQQFAGLVAQGMITDNGDSYSTTIAFADGTATVNGTPLPLGAMGLF